MAQSDTGLCNDALQRIGAASILNMLTDNSKEARQCKLAYDKVRRSELRKHRWNFAIKRAILAPDVIVPLFDFLYAFTLPSDCLRILLPSENYLDWKLEGRKILTNSGAVLNLRYLVDVTDPNQFDAAFYDMFSISLGLSICEAITGSTGKMATLERDYREARAEAKRNNAFEQGPQEPVDDTWWVR
jgi:hypothetical protein